MTKPQAQKLFDFSSWAADHPNDPVPGDRLDIQLDNHRQAIQALTDAVQNLLRADGKLNHDLITPESLPKQILGDLAQRIRRDIEDFATPLLALAGRRQSQIEIAQLDLRATLDEIKQRQREARGLLDQARTLSAFLEDRVHSASAKISQALRTNARYLETSNDQTKAAAVAEDWAQVSIEWAEHMPDTIPPNILATNAITGEHWSARWWASRAAGAAGMLAWWYLGAFPDPGPPSTPLTPTGDPIPVGAMYFNTTHNVLMVWNGSAWVSTLPGTSKTVTQSLYYHSSAAQTVFPLTTLDLYGHNFTYDLTITEGTQVIVAGDRVEPSTFTIDTATSTVTFHSPVNPAGTLVVFDILTPPSEFAAGICLVNPIPVDGTTVTFGGLTIVAGAIPVNATRSEDLTVSVDGVIQEPVIQYSAFGDSITFVTAPSADSDVFMIWFGPVASGGSGGGGGTPSNTPPLMDADPALVGTSTTFARGDHRHPRDTSKLSLSGGTMTGTLVLASDPAAGAEAATKSYVDAHLGGGGGGGSVFVGASPPSSATAGELWFDSTGGQLYVYYDDGTSAQWVIVTNEPGPVGPTGAPGPTSAAIDLNKIVNSDFTINQRSYVSAAALTAAAYGHDRWKAGASGCTYTFTPALPETTITITAGSLTQVIEAAAIGGGAHVLSWTGTAQARVYQGSPTGSYAASPVVVASLTTGTNTIIEFNAGTLTKTKFEPGSVATPYTRQSPAKTLLDCQRFYQRFGGKSANDLTLSGQCFSSSDSFAITVSIPAMRSSPTATLGAAMVTTNAGSPVFVASPSTLVVKIPALAAGMVYWVNSSGSPLGYINLDAEL